MIFQNKGIKSVMLSYSFSTKVLKPYFQNKANLPEADGLSRNKFIS